MLNAMVAQDYVKIYRDLHYDLFILSNRMRHRWTLPKKSALTLNRSHCEILFTFPLQRMEIPHKNNKINFFDNIRY